MPGTRSWRPGTGAGGLFVLVVGNLAPACAPESRVEGICIGDKRSVYADSCKECIQTAGACRARCEAILAVRTPECADAGHAHFRCLFELEAPSLTCAGDEPQRVTYANTCTTERDAFLAACNLGPSDAGLDVMPDGGVVDGSRDASPDAGSGTTDD